MTTPASTAPPFDPPRRAFGSFSKQQTGQSRPARPSSAASSSSSSTPVPTPSTNSPYLFAPPPEPQRTRSTSSASSEAFENAAVKAQAWLSTWAPKGEGRGREFLSNTLNGVAGVASTVTHGINGAVNKGVQLSSEGRGVLSRPSSFSAGSATSPQDSFTVPAPSLSPSQSAIIKTPPGPTHTSSSSALPTGRKVPQPANISRLSANTSPPPPSDSSLRPPLSHPPTSTGAPYSHRHTTSSSSLLPVQPHGPSHLNPNAHVRNGSHSHSRSHSFGAGRTPSLSRSSSTATGGPSLASRSAGMPYKLGFQPAGVKNDRTETFLEAREHFGEERDKEEGRLGRRWAKLVDLHFNPTMPSPSTQPSLTRSPSSSLSLASTADKRRSLLSIDGALDALKGPRDVWKGVKTNLDPRSGPAAEEARKRAAEQAIVKWEDDSEAKKCRICQSSFNLSNRKHHCRLCGRIVCSLPPTPAALLAVEIQLFSSGETTNVKAAAQAPLPAGTRREKCSLLLVADWKSGRGEEVDEGFVGWMRLQEGDVEGGAKVNGKKERRRSRLSMGPTTVEPSVSEEEKKDLLLPQQPKEVQVKGVRACRECWATVSRKQKIADRQRVNSFARLYQALRVLQSEIENVMPDFEEQMDELTSSVEAEDPPPVTIQMHKQLLNLFAQYEHLSKRISSLPVEEGSSQSTVQSAVARSAAMFLAKEMVKVQALPKLQKRMAEMKRQGLNVSIVETTLAEQLKLGGVEESQAVDVAVVLQPLLEQEAQLEGMITDAHAQRKYEDSKALGVALEEIRSEIARVTQRVIT